jgi:hypothetical protein
MNEIIEFLRLLIVFLLIIAFTYFVFVGIFLLINITFGTSLNIWAGGLLGTLTYSMIKSK